jgi:rhodanese-related sulfurtransferase
VAFESGEARCVEPQLPHAVCTAGGKREEMKKLLLSLLILSSVLVSIGPSTALADVDPKGPAISGAIVGGFRVLDVPEASPEVKLTVYRGDYIKFKLADPTTETALSIPDLSIRQRLSGNLDEAPYFKMEKSGTFPFVLGTAEGSITVVDYRQANYQEVTSKEAAELIRNITPLVLDVRTPGEYGRGHLKDSVLIPLQQLQARWQEIAGYKDKDVLIYCATGNRSTVAAKILIDSGFKRIYNLRHGISGWEREKNPVVQ